MIYYYTFKGEKGLYGIYSASGIVYAAQSLEFVTGLKFKISDFVFAEQIQIGYITKNSKGRRVCKLKRPIGPQRAARKRKCGK